MTKYIPHNSTRYKNINVMLQNNKVKNKELPKLYEKRENCCGCSACYAICPMNAIAMEPDEEGFLYPIVDVAVCIRCYKCLSVCGFKKAQKEINNG